jgi:hypothetical protein
MNERTHAALAALLEWCKGSDSPEDHDVKVELWIELAKDLDVYAMRTIAITLASMLARHNPDLADRLVADYEPVRR